ncbi:hypothetical protein THIOSC13_1280007 [uncultured Thiomicrorhabdus sp.]
MKRLFDTLLIVLSLPILLPVLLVLALLVRLKLGSPILFKQLGIYLFGNTDLIFHSFKMFVFSFFTSSCYNYVNITATPIEEAQPWRFFIACKM